MIGNTGTTEFGNKNPLKAVACSVHAPAVHLLVAACLCAPRETTLLATIELNAQSWAVSSRPRVTVAESPRGTVATKEGGVRVLLFFDLGFGRVRLDGSLALFLKP